MKRRASATFGRDVWAMGWAGSWLLRGLLRTLRVRRLGEQHLRPYLERHEGALLTFWHGQLLPLACVMSFRHPVILVSEHRDGEIITQIIRHLGCGTVRGSTTRGGYRSLLEMARLGRAGQLLGITPDGPRGPRHTVHPGAILVAQRGGIPMIPLAAFAHPEKRLHSWDRFQVPLPGSRLVVSLGRPLYVPAELGPQAAVRDYGPRLAEAMKANARRASDELAAWIGRPGGGCG